MNTEVSLAVIDSAKSIGLVVVGSLVGYWFALLGAKRKERAEYRERRLEAYGHLAGLAARVPRTVDITPNMRGPSPDESAQTFKELREAAYRTCHLLVPSDFHELERLFEDVQSAWQLIEFEPRRDAEYQQLVAAFAKQWAKLSTSVREMHQTQCAAYRREMRAP